MQDNTRLPDRQAMIAVTPNDEALRSDGRTGLTRAGEGLIFRGSDAGYFSERHQQGPDILGNLFLHGFPFGVGL